MTSLLPGYVNKYISPHPMQLYGSPNYSFSPGVYLLKIRPKEKRKKNNKNQNKTKTKPLFIQENLKDFVLKVFGQISLTPGDYNLQVTELMKTTTTAAITTFDSLPLLLIPSIHY